MNWNQSRAKIILCWHCVLFLSALVLIQNNKNFDGCIVTPWYNVGFEVTTAVDMKSSIFWNIKLSSWLKVNQRFRERHRHLQGWSISQARNQHEAGSKLACYHFTLVSCLASSLTLKMEMTCSSKTSVDFQWTTQHHIPEDRMLPWYKLFGLPV
jgi:hypothetical protein